MRCQLTALMMTGVCLAVCASAQADKTYVNDEIELRHEVRVGGKLYRVYDGGAVAIVTDREGRIVRDKAAAGRAARAGAIWRRWLNSAEVAEHVRHRGRIDEFIKLEGAAQIAMFVRDSASKALVDVSVAYMTGDPSTFTKSAAKKVLTKAAKDAMKDTVLNMAKDPDNYLRAMAVSMLKACRSDLRALERAASRFRGGRSLDSEEMEKLDAMARATYAKIVPAMRLTQALRPGADVKSQLKSVLGTMRQRLNDQIPGGSEAVDARRTRSVYSKMGKLVDELYARYEPYKKFREEKLKYESMSDKDGSARRAHAMSKLDLGWRMTKGHALFHPRAPRPDEEPAPDGNVSSTGGIPAFAANWGWSRSRNQDGRYGVTVLTMPRKFTSLRTVDKVTLSFSSSYSQRGGVARASVFISTTRSVKPKDARHDKGRYWYADKRGGREKPVGTYTTTHRGKTCTFDITDWVRRNRSQKYYVIVENQAPADIGVGKVRVHFSTPGTGAKTALAK